MAGKRKSSKMATIFLKPNLPLNVAVRARIENKLAFLELSTKKQIGSKVECPVIIFDCSKERALDRLSSVKSPNLQHGWEVNFEIVFEEKRVKLIGTAEHFGEGYVVLGEFVETPVMPPLPEDFLKFRGHFTLSEIFFLDSRQINNPKHFFFITSGEDGSCPQLELVGEQALAAFKAKKSETKLASINDQFNNLLLEVKGNKRPREDNETE